MKQKPSSSAHQQTSKENVEKRLDNIELALLEIKENLKTLNKEIDMTQKMIRVEAVTNALHVEQELKKKILELHKEDLEKLDHIVGELQTLRDENSIGAYQITDVREELGELQKRVKKLEQTSNIS
jgi:hypothetical protein